MINWIKEQLHRLTAPDEDLTPFFEAEVTVTMGDVMVHVHGVDTLDDIEDRVFSILHRLDAEMNHKPTDKDCSVG